MLAKEAHCRPLLPIVVRHAEPTPRAAKIPGKYRGVLKEPASILILNATVWTSGPPGVITNASVRIADGRIAAIGPDIGAPIPFNGIITGSGSPLLGSPSLATSSFRAPVMARNIDTKIEIFSDSPMPCRMQSAEWEGWLQNRAPRI